MLKATDDKGFGVFAGSFIPKGSFITTYLGRYVSSETEKQSTNMRVYKHNIGQVFLGSNSWETNFYAQAYNVSNNIVIKSAIRIMYVNRILRSNRSTSRSLKTSKRPQRMVTIQVLNTKILQLDHISRNSKTILDRTFFVKNSSSMRLTR